MQAAEAKKANRGGSPSLDGPAVRAGRTSRPAWLRGAILKQWKYPGPGKAAAPPRPSMVGAEGLEPPTYAL